MFLRLDENPYGRDIVIGDLHGCYLHLMGLLDSLSFDPERDRVIATGDMINRGPDTIACLSLLDEDWFYTVRGNHEAKCIDSLSSFYGREREAKRGPAKWFNELSDEQLDYIRMKLEALPVLIELPCEPRLYAIVHAEIPPGFNYRDAREAATHFASAGRKERLLLEDMTTSRLRYFDHGQHKEVKHVDRIFVGHTLCGDKPVVLGNHAYLDTQCFRTGRLSAAVLGRHGCEFTTYHAPINTDDTLEALSRL